MNQHRKRRIFRGLLLGLLLGLSGCFNDGKQVIDLGSVSIGQQLLDLKAAHDAGAISDAEYADAKASFLNITESISELIDE